MYDTNARFTFEVEVLEALEELHLAVQLRSDEHCQQRTS
jgi:hypothetical protein